MKRKRTKARELALQLLFAIENSSFKPEEVIEVFWQERKKVHPETRDFTNLLVSGTLENLDDLDQRIIQLLENWELKRLACIDKILLRMAIFELTSFSQTPTAVIINEAIELAKTYSTAASHKFINGILDKIRVRETESEDISPRCLDA